MILRPNTYDQIIYHQVVNNNEYQLPEKFSSEDIIVDIGAHIGCFSLAALQRGCQKIIAIEADIENFKIAEKNLHEYILSKKVILLHAAVWRSDMPATELYFSGYPQHFHRNTGGGDVLWATTGQICTTINFDTLLADITQNFQHRIQLLKIDCEGSEWPILLTSRHLDCINHIVGEFHEIGGEYDQHQEMPFDIHGYTHFTQDVLEQYLKKWHFDLKIQREYNLKTGQSTARGLFFAVTNMGVKC